MLRANLFDRIPANLAEEVTDILVTRPGLRVERIVSQNHASPAGFWYEQTENEWVLLIQGAAKLKTEGQVIDLQPGNFVNLPAGQKHRVEWTTPDEPTIWLAIFYL